MATLPDGWQFSTLAPGAIASIILPAGDATIRHKLTHLLIEAATINPPAAVIFDSTLVVLDGATNIFSWRLSQFTLMGDVGTVVFEEDVTLMGSPATSMTVAFTGLQASTVEKILIKGQDV